MTYRYLLDEDDEDDLTTYIYVPDPVGSDNFIVVGSIVERAVRYVCQWCGTEAVQRNGTCLNCGGPNG